MIELDELALRAPVPVFAHERALALIALPDFAPDTRRDMPEAFACLPRPWLVRGREPAALQLRDQGLERHLEHGGDVPGRQLVAEQVLGIAQGLVRLLVDRDLERKPLRRQGLHRGTIRRRWCRDREIN